FFSSRRRHTRFSRDWSSDVCSSDLHGKADPDIVAANLGIFDTMAWVWAGIGLTSGSLAVAGIRHGSLPRWLGWLSAVVTGLVVLTQLLPVQYMAAIVGAPWLVAAGAGLARADRA